ncbi:zinc ribbon domain-containing protein [Neorhodopirellula pilleata]|uniref:Putative zinc ribbon domain protein n=1 Tax=Neorhodopirellula pilleata TaxID=2714738 RepID=A0A5C6A9K0_9BACT|nr:C4-type zinc ribbon domain-containing protein [Neorhodopirellula pilleata]TWT96229.1 putative zinc ribbon domain protein [Neorhodopirellula pilleata]
MAASVPVDFDSRLLRRLHRIHQQRADLQSQARRGPLQLKAVEATVTNAQTEVERAAAVLKKTKMIADEKQLQLQSREAHLRDLNRKLNAAASNREFTLLKEQIAADEQANSVQSDEIFEILERLDALNDELDKTKAQLADVEADKVQREAEIRKRQQQVAFDLERVEIQLEEAEAEIPAVVKADYRRLVDARGEEALAPIENDSCGGCSQTLTTQVVSQVMLSKLTYCPNCNAILYQQEDTRI